MEKSLLLSKPEVSFRLKPASLTDHDRNLPASTFKMCPAKCHQLSSNACFWMNLGTIPSGNLIPSNGTSDICVFLGVPLMSNIIERNGSPILRNSRGGILVAILRTQSFCIG